MGVVALSLREGRLQMSKSIVALLSNRLNISAALASSALVLGGCLVNAAAETPRGPAPAATRDHRAPMIASPEIVELTARSFGDPRGSLEVAAPPLGTQDFTVSHWYRTSFAGDSVLGDVLGNRQAPSHGNFLAVRLRGDGVLSFEVDQDEAGTNYAAVDSGGARINDGAWHYLVYTRRGGELSVFVDGNRIARAGNPNAAAADLLAATPFRLGRSLPDCCSNYVDVPGAYADVTIVPGRALNDDEVRASHADALRRAPRS